MVVIVGIFHFRQNIYRTPSNLRRQTVTVERTTQTITAILNVYEIVTQDTCTIHATVPTLYMKVCLFMYQYFSQNNFHVNYSSTCIRSSGHSKLISSSSDNYMENKVASERNFYFLFFFPKLDSPGS